MIKKIACIGLSLCLCGQALAQSNSYDRRQQQVIDLVTQEEKIVLEELSKVEALTQAIANVETSNTFHKIVIPSSIGVGVVGGFVTAGALGESGKISQGAALAIGGVILAVGAVVAINSTVQLVLSGSEMTRLQSNLDIARKSLEIRQQGLNSLKARIGIDIKGLEVETNGKALTTPLVIPAQ